MSAIDQSQMPRAQPGREVVPKPVVGKKPYPFWLGGMSPSFPPFAFTPSSRLFQFPTERSEKVVTGKREEQEGRIKRKGADT